MSIEVVVEGPGGTRFHQDQNEWEIEGAEFQV